MKHWIKLWARWYETPSHAFLSPYALHSGPRLILAAAQAGADEDGAGWLVGPDGKPLTATELATLTRWSVRRVRQLLAELVKVGTMVEAGGRYGFPNLGRYQESPSAAKMRRFRSQDGHATSHTAGHSDRKVTREAEAEAEAEPPTPPAPDPLSLADAVLVDLAYMKPAGARDFKAGIDRRGLSVAIDAFGLPKVREVARYVADEVNAGAAEPREWAELFMFGGQRFATWLQRLEEGTETVRYGIRDGIHYKVEDGDWIWLTAAQVKAAEASGVVFAEDE